MSKKHTKGVGPGPVRSRAGVPYDYIVVIDSGSKGSRVYVYRWLNPAAALATGADWAQAASANDLRLVRHGAARDVDSDSDDDGPETPKAPALKLPKVASSKKWRAKVKPGLASYNNSPQKIGRHHLRGLLRLASQVVPKSQHHRTPIFLHSTAGMRLLNPTEQGKVLTTVCRYLEANSDFYLPDCSSHVNVIEGDEEGLYGWLAINYMVGTFDDPSSHQHGKNHTTYGLLDMGGASTQVVFQPNSTEIADHSNNLYKIKLAQVPERLAEGHAYAAPRDMSFDVYSDSFLGLGMAQAYYKYQASLIASSNTPPAGLFSYYRSPIEDPCMPKGFTATAMVDKVKYDLIGTSNFHSCMTSIFPVIRNSTYGSSSQTSGNCQAYDDGAEVSSCLLNDLIPAFDFDVNHFYGVSGYWHALSKLLAYDLNKSDRKLHRRKSKSDYDYNIIYNRTSKICSKSFSSLLELNNLKKDGSKLTDTELSKLCFESSWILNFLHLGLGFPRFGIDEVKKPDQFQSLQMVDKVNGADFSWTLGRALLYANDEYVQAYNNISGQNIERSGFSHSTLATAFHYGAEQNGVSPRPQYTDPSPDAKYHYYDYEKDTSYYKSELKWNIEPHRWYGIMTFVFLLGFIFWLLVGREGRSRMKTALRSKASQFKGLFVKGEQRYASVQNDLEANDLELSNLGSHKIDDEFVITDDENENSNSS